MTTEQPQLLDYAVGAPFRAFSTTRQGGVSTGAYASLNINSFCGDDPVAIAENRRRLAAHLGLQGDDRLVLPHQVHGTRVEALAADFLELSPADRAARLEGVDAVMTDVAGLCVGVSTADCIPLLLYDTEHRAVCAVHAGWRGTVQRIARTAVEAMASHYGSRPEALHAIVGPGISLEAFEVGDEVYEAFRAADFPMSSIARRFPKVGAEQVGAADSRPPLNLSATKKSDPTEKWHIDLPAANVDTLLQSGLDLANIRVSSICTYGQSDRFFSARRLGIHSGRIYSGVFIQ